MPTTHSGEVIKCKECNSEHVTESTRYGFKVRKDRQIKVYGIVSLVTCIECKKEFACIDSTEDKLFWLTLTPYPQEGP